MAPNQTSAGCTQRTQCYDSPHSTYASFFLFADIAYKIEDRGAQFWVTTPDWSLSHICHIAFGYWCQQPLLKHICSLFFERGIA